LALLSVYLNPVKKGIDIHLKIENNSASEISLYDISGKLLKKQQINKNNNIMNTQDLSRGSYIYKIISADSHVLSSGKIIVE
jgi:methionine-rich copper-binding protein CopC